MGKLRRGSPGYLFCFAVGLMAGILLGAVALNILVSHRIDSYHKTIAQLRADIRDKDSRLEKLEQSLNTQKYLLQAVEVTLLFGQDGKNGAIVEVDEMERMEIESNIKEKYVSLLGKEVDTIDVDMVAEVVDRRIFKIGTREYVLHVVRLILSETLRIWVRVEVID
ncbi:MAG: hypothetical protein GX349_06480 [Firmicutes bacterium]|nr:hypothetical protein [Bacillota bacterium]